MTLESDKKILIRASSGIQLLVEKILDGKTKIDPGKLCDVNKLEKYHDLLKEIFESIDDFLAGVGIPRIITDQEADWLLHQLLRAVSRLSDLYNCPEIEQKISDAHDVLVKFKKPSAYRCDGNTKCEVPTGAVKPLKPKYAPIKEKSWQESEGEQPTEAGQNTTSAKKKRRLNVIYSFYEVTVKGFFSALFDKMGF